MQLTVAEEPVDDGIAVGASASSPVIERRVAEPAPRPGRARLAALGAVGVGLFAVFLFWPAGTVVWPAAWVYLALVAANFVINMVYLNRVNPQLIAHRLRPGPGTKGWDYAVLAVFTVAFVAIYVVAAFDAVRFQWSAMPLWYGAIGLALFAPGTALYTWSMGVNPFFEKTVRIQSERAHRVIDTGPYAIVRHPGYLGFFGWALSAPLLLGSWFAFVPAVIAIAVLVFRTALEDRTLLRELDGYRDYAARVRFRLVPGLW